MLFPNIKYSLEYEILYSMKKANISELLEIRRVKDDPEILPGSGNVLVDSLRRKQTGSRG